MREAFWAVDQLGHAWLWHGSPHLMTWVAVGNQDTTAAVFNGLGSIYMVSAPPHRGADRFGPPLNGAGRVGQGGQRQQDSSNPGWPFSSKKSACDKLVSSNRACQIPGGHFHRKKSACGKMVSSNRACQIQGWSFSPKKSACGKLVSSNRACRIQGWPFSPEKKRLRQAG